MPSRAYDKPVTIEVQDQSTEQWTPVWRLHAHVNRTGGGSTPLSAGAERFVRTLDFEVRWFEGIEAVGDMPTAYRLVYRGQPYDIADYDDFMERHKTVTLTGTGVS